MIVFNLERFERSVLVKLSDKGFYHFLERSLIPSEKKALKIVALPGVPKKVLHFSDQQ